MAARPGGACHPLPTATPPSPGSPRAARSRRSPGARSRRSACAKARAGSRAGPDVLLDERDDLLRGLLGRLVLGVHDERGILRRLVRVGHAGELLDLALEGLLVEALDVALGASLDGSLDVDLEEAVTHRLVGLVADLGIWRYRGGD